MSITLSQEWQFVVDNNRAYVERTADGVRVATLDALESVALSFMDGNRSQDAVVSMMQDIAGDAGSFSATQLQSKLSPLLTSEQMPLKSASYDLEQLAGLDTPNKLEGIRVLPGPKVLHWWVTNICPRRCVYCFADPEYGSKAYDATLSSDRLREIFREAASLGANFLLAAGGEPLLRPDLPEILADAIAVGIDPGITTKYPINSALATRLAEAGLSHICLSVDSFSQSKNQLLIGSSNYGNQVIETTRHLKNAGIEFSFEFVVTKLNTEELEPVVRRSEDLGARVLQIVPYEQVRNPISSYTNEDLMPPDSFDIDEVIESLSLRYGGVLLEKFEQLGETSQNNLNCDIGFTKMLFNPDGLVHRCYKLLDDDLLFGADLKQVSVAEAWHDRSFFDRTSPPQNNYAGSPCSNCSKFNNCHDDGRCIFQSLVDNGTYYGKDRSCSGPHAN